MKALDANVLVRFLVNEDDLQSKLMYRAIKQAETEKNTPFRIKFHPRLSGSTFTVPG